MRQSKPIVFSAATNGTTKQTTSNGRHPRGTPCFGSGAPDFPSHINTSEMARQLHPQAEVQQRAWMKVQQKRLLDMPVMCYVFRQKFQRNESRQPGVFGLVDHTHTTATKFLDDAVM
jgi:hypothetical protein